MKAAVFDASALVKLVHEEPGTHAAHSAFRECSSPPVAPDWAMLECAQALWRKMRAGDLTAEQTLRRFEALAAIDLRINETTHLGEAALSLALTLQHPVYDCAYVALALAEEAALVTADRGQRDVAQAAGVEVVWIGPDR